MRILQLASEAVPFAKTGGLADVVGALARHLPRAGHEVELVLPLYRAVDARHGIGGGSTVVPFSGSDLGTRGEGRLVSGPALDGARTWFVDVPELYDRDGLYGSGGADHPDNLLRFAAFCRAALLASERLDLAPDVVHCHDWQAALAPAWLSKPADPPTVLTIHNLSYQGWFPATARAGADAGVAPERRVPGTGDVNLLAAGIRAAGRVTTVSPTYAREILRPEHGCGLDGELRSLDAPVAGILNGIDVETWNPADDPHLPRGWTSADMSGKRAARGALAEEFDIDTPDGVPVFGLVSRLVEQKGIGLLLELGERIAGWPDARFVIVGTGEPRFERGITELAASLPQVAARITFDERLAHLVEGGADFFLMPSAFEPCGLNQMISQRYGTVPIVHRTGGLADTVTPVNAATLASGTASGVVFEHFDAAGLEWAVEEARRLYADRPTFETVRASIMRIDHSWAERLAAYETVFEGVRRTRSRSGTGVGAPVPHSSD